MIALRRWTPCVGVVAAVLVFAACADDSAPAAPNGQHELDLRFNGSAAPIDLRNSGVTDVDVTLTTAGGEVRSVRRGKGRAARFPDFSQTPAAAALVIVASGARDRLSPGSRGFAVGADFRLDATSEGSAYDNGNNLIQRGLFDGPQVKIQLDGRRPSCRVAGSGGSVFVESTVRVSPRYWHRVSCTRRSDTVTLALTRYRDGSAATTRWRRSGPIGSLDFARETPMSVGAKVDGTGAVVSTDSDQFNGRVDNARFRLL